MTSTRHAGRLSVPTLMALVVGLTCSLLASLMVKSYTEDEARRRLSLAVDQVLIKLTERLNSYALTIKGGSGLFAGSGTVTRREWRRYVEQLQLEVAFPGIQGVGFTRRIAPERLAEHIREVRREGFPSYTVRPDGQRAMYSSIVFLEPFQGRNLRAFGFDMYSEPVRRAAMDRAMDTGEPALSGKVVLVQETHQDVQAGTLMYFPVYREGAPVQTVAERRAALVGWTYSPYRMTDLVSGVLSGLESGEAGSVEMHIFDGNAAHPESLLFDKVRGLDPDPRSPFYQERRLSFGGNQWTLVFDRGTAAGLPGAGNAWVVGLGGALISVLLAGLLHSLATTRIRAGVMAEELTASLRASERELKASEEKFSTLFRDSPLPAALTRAPDYVFADANRAFLDLFGYSREELIGKTSLELKLYGVASRQRIFDALDRHMGRTEIEMDIRPKSGPPIPVAAQFSRVVIEGREFILGVTADITERKRSEKVIRQLSQAVEQSPESIVITNADGTIEYVNDAFVSNTGYSREEALGSNPRILQSGLTPASTYAALWETLGRGLTWRGEFVNRRKDGSDYVEMVIISPLRQVDGQVTHYVAVKEDITEMKRIRQELDAHRLHLEDLVGQRTAELEVATMEAQSANRAKSDFLANMSHEIRTPLNGVLGVAQIGYRDHGDQPRARDLFGRIIDSGHLLMTIINDILDLSKIEAGKLAIEALPVRPGALAKTALHDVETTGKARNIALTLHLAPDLPDACIGDPVRISQILLNLLTNAVKFTERGEVRLEASRAGNDLVFSVVDTGIGIPTDQLERLFLPFEQADRGTTRRFGGTGLGLTISRRLAQLMGGALTARSAPGQGSTFRLVLPLVEIAADRVEDAAPAPGRRRLAGLRLLVAEDNAVNRFVIEDILSTEGAEVELVGNGEEALAAATLTEPSFDAVLMDVEMPVMDGLEATRRILLERPGLPVIGQTAHALAEGLATCRAAGMTRVVTKPLEIEELVRTVLEATRTQSS